MLIWILYNGNISSLGKLISFLTFHCQKWLKISKTGTARTEAGGLEGFVPPMPVVLMFRLSTASNIMLANEARN